MKRRRYNNPSFSLGLVVGGLAAAGGLYYWMTRRQSKASINVPGASLVGSIDQRLLPSAPTGPLALTEQNAIDYARQMAAQAKGLTSDQVQSFLAQGRQLGLNDPTLRTSTQTLIPA